MTEIGHAVLAANNLTDVATRKQLLGIESGIRSALVRYGALLNASRPQPN